MFIIIFFSLFSFSEQGLFPGLFPSCQSRPESFDEVAAQLFAIGDPCHSFPTDEKKAAELCDKYRNWVTANEVDGQLSPYFVRQGIISMYNFTAQEVCRLYEQNPTQMIEFAKELNSKTASLYKTRQNILDTAYYTQHVKIVRLPCHTKMGRSMVACAIVQWFRGAIVVLSPSARAIAQQLIKTYMKIVADFDPLPFCVSLPPRLGDTEYTSVDMNFLISTKICFEGL